MQRLIQASVFLGYLSIFSAHQTATAQPMPRVTYKVTSTYSLPGVGGWGFLAVDPQRRLIYVPHGSQVQIVNADTGKLQATLADTPRVHGIALAPDLNRAFTSNEGDGTITIFDTETLKPIKKVEAYRPDFMFYDPFSKRVFPLHDTTTVIDGVTGEHVGDLDFGGAAEQAVSDEKGRIYVTVAEGDYIAVVDPKTVKIINKYSFSEEECPGPVSLSFDLKGDRLYTGCMNGIEVVQASTGKKLAHVYTCKSDQTAFDPNTGLLYQSCWDGTIGVIREVKPNSFAVVDALWIGESARVLGFDPVTRKVFVPTAEYQDVETGDPENPIAHKSKEGTFKLTVAQSDDFHKP